MLLLIHNGPFTVNYKPKHMKRSSQGELHVEPDVGKQPVFREMVLRWRITITIILTFQRKIIFFTTMEELSPSPTMISLSLSSPSPSVEAPQ